MCVGFDIRITIRITVNDPEFDKVIRGAQVVRCSVFRQYVVSLTVGNIKGDARLELKEPLNTHVQSIIHPSSINDYIITLLS